MARIKSDIELPAKPRMQFYIDVNLKELLSQRAREEKIHQSQIIIKALILYLTKDINDESLLIAKLTELQRQVEYIEKKVDIGQKKDIQWEQFLLTFQPELPSETASRDLRIKRASQRYLQFLTQFRDRSKALPSMLESVLGDLKEEPKEKEIK
jgi:hypothetical protein